MNKDYKLYVHIVPNGKRYYGITKQEPEQRWRKKGSGYNTQYFARAINKYGWDNIEHIVLQEGLDEEEAKELEQYMIQWYDTTNSEYGYNISLGGEISNHSEETRKKIGKAHKGKVVSEETRKKISKAGKGRVVSEETRKKIGKAHKNRYFSEEHRQKLSKAQTSKKNHKAKSVICITTNSVFYAIMDAERYCNVSNSKISACCRGKQKSAGKSPTGEKLVWKYIDIIEL